MAEQIPDGTLQRGRDSQRLQLVRRLLIASLDCAKYDGGAVPRLTAFVAVCSAFVLGRVARSCARALIFLNMLAVTFSCPETVS